MQKARRPCTLNGTLKIIFVFAVLDGGCIEKQTKMFTHGQVPERQVCYVLPELAKFPICDKLLHNNCESEFSDRIRDAGHVGIY